MIRYVYVAGPYTSGDQMMNIRRAIQTGNLLLAYGFVPFVPHLTGFWDFVSPKLHTEWLALDDAWLQKCDAVLRIQGDSGGADREVARATELGIPVFTDLRGLYDASRAPKREER